MEPTRTWVRPPTSCPSISKCAPPLLASDRAGAAHYPARMRGASENRNQQRDACYRRTPECRSKTCLCKARPASQRVPPVIARLPKGHTKPSVSALFSVGLLTVCPVEHTGAGADFVRQKRLFDLIVCANVRATPAPLCQCRCRWYHEPASAPSSIGTVLAFVNLC